MTESLRGLESYPTEPRATAEHKGQCFFIYSQDLIGQPLLLPPPKAASVPGATTPLLPPEREKWISPFLLCYQFLSPHPSRMCRRGDCLCPTYSRGWESERSWGWSFVLLPSSTKIYKVIDGSDTERSAGAGSPWGKTNIIYDWTEQIMELSV